MKRTQLPPARPRSRRSTRGGGRRVQRRPHLRVGWPNGSALEVEPAAGAAEPLQGEAPLPDQADESLYQLGDGSDCPAIDVRADVEVGP